MVFWKGCRGRGAEEWTKFGPLSFPSLYKPLPLPPIHPGRCFSFSPRISPSFSGQPTLRNYCIHNNVLDVWRVKAAKGERDGMIASGWIWVVGSRVGRGESKIARVRLPGHFSRRPGTPQLIRFGCAVSGGGHTAISLLLYLPTVKYIYTYIHIFIYTPGPDNRYNRTWRMPTIATTLSSFSEIRTFKTVSSTLADSLDRYFNPFLAPPDPAAPR